MSSLTDDDNNKKHVNKTMSSLTGDNNDKKHVNNTMSLLTDDDNNNNHNHLILLDPKGKKKKNSKQSVI